MAKLYDLTVTTGTYEVNGEKKYRTLNVGSVWEGKDGRPFTRLNRSFNPAGVPVPDLSQDSIICNMWEPKDRPQSPAPKAGAAPDFDDDMPF